MANCNDTTSSSTTEVSNIIKADINFKVIKGDTFDAVLTFKDAQQKPLSFAGATLLMQIRDENDIEVEELQPGAEFIVTNNIITFNYVTTLNVGVYYYDLQCTFANGTIKTLIGGKYKVYKEITIP
jgi:hypothetical protein